MRWLLSTGWMFVTFASLLVAQELHVSYTLKEQRPNNTYLGNVASDTNLQSLVGDQFRTITYSFLRQGYPHVSKFRVEESTSAVYTTQELDRESICEFDVRCVIDLELSARSSIGVFFRKIKITIFLEDINDETPTFPKPVFHLSIPESVIVGTPYLIDYAVDKDSENNSVKSYEILPVNSPFKIAFKKNLDGRFTVNIIVNETLDRERRDNYQIQVLAKDGGNQQRTGVLLVNVTVTDVNDNFPKFTQEKYNITVNEDVEIGTSVLKVTATDLDIGLNSKILYKLSSHQSEEIQSLFSINETNGELSVIGPLIYKSSQVYKVIVEASDLGESPRMAQTYVTVNVFDSENQAPQININLLSNVNVSKVSEYASIGAVVAHVAVIESDTGNNAVVTCKILSDNFELLWLEGREYKVIVSRPLDRENQARHSVSINCTDAGWPPLSTSKNFTVEVTDENDNEPKFLQQIYKATLEENNGLGNVIVVVSATEKDIGLNGKVRYDLLPDAYSNFEIESETGKVKAGKVFDRETAAQYKFSVLAVDRGSPAMTATATVVLDILDQNDNNPVFSPSHRNFNIDENQPKGTLVGKITADDKDSDFNKEIIYSISPASVPFEIRSNGEMLTKMPLDREALSKYDFNVIAVDQGIPSRTGTARVVVRIADENDNAPEILFPSFDNNTVSVPYILSPNSVVTSVKAADSDAGENGTVLFSIQERNDSHIFNINGKTGEILLVREIDSADVNWYTLEITVSDHGSQPKVTWAKLNLVVSSGLTVMEDDANRHNLLIAVTVVVLTVVVSATIVITICIIRRVDRQKRKLLETSSEGSGNDAEIPQVVKESRKEVRFTPENSMLGSLMAYSTEKSLDQCDGNFSSQTTYQIPTQINADCYNQKQENHQRELQIQENSNSPHEEAHQKEITRLASLRLHQVLLQSHDQHWTNQQEEQLSKDALQLREQDSHSASSGETTMSDSGRGGSESDIHSNGGLSHSHDSDQMRYLHTSNNQLPQSGRRGTAPHKNHSGVTVVSPRGKIGAGVQMGLSSFAGNHNQNSQTFSPHGYRVNLDYPKYDYYRTGQPCYSVDMDDTMESVMTYDDDDNTTTSGSYTIDPDDLLTEMPRIHRVKDVFV